MRNLRQSRMLKAVAVVLLFFTVLAIPLSIAGEIYLARRVFDSSRAEMFGGAFEDSQIFSGLFSKRIGQLAEYIELKNILETDGELDYGRVVCRTTDDAWADSAEHTIGELIRQNDFFVEDIDTYQDVLLEELFNVYYSHPQTYVYMGEDGKAEFSSLYGEKFIQDFENMESWIAVKAQEDALGLFAEEEADVEEAFSERAKDSLLGVGAEQTLSAVQPMPVTKTGLPEDGIWVFTLNELSYRYTYYVAYYLYYHELFAVSEGSRFIYEVSNGTDTYTNVEDAEAYRLGRQKTNGMLNYRSSEYTVETDIKNVKRSYVDNLEKALTGGDGEAVIFAAVRQESSSTPGDDIFHLQELRYQNAQGICGILLVAGIAGIFGTLLAGFYLVASAGHAKGVEGVRLTGFDKWYTEIAGVICAVLLSCCIAMTGSMISDIFHGSYMDGSLALSLAMAGNCLVLSYLSAIFSLATLLRRIKAGTLWRNSFLRNGTLWIIRTCRRTANVCRVVYEERDATARVIIAYIMVLAATVITGTLIMISLWSGRVLVLFFLLLFAGIHVGTLYILMRERIDYKHIVEGIERMADGDLNYKIDEMGLQTDNRRLAVAANRVGDGLAEAVEKSIKDERMKADLITNVSHDIKTPLTSIINYVDLLKREKIEDDKIRSYIDVLDSKSQRLKNLTDDLVEASKLSSGNIILTMQEIDLVELVNQANGEFSEKFEQKNLTIVSSLPDNQVIIEADGRRIWRVLENLYNNVAKYAMEKTRVYVSVVPVMDRVSFIIKNISASPLNISAEELTERFIRGDVSRSTEGSGLGLSIAQSLTELMKGSFEIYLDGDLFRATVTFPLKTEPPGEEGHVKLACNRSANPV